MWILDIKNIWFKQLCLGADKSRPPQTFKSDRIAMPLMKMGCNIDINCWLYHGRIYVISVNEHIIHHIKSPRGIYKESKSGTSYSALET